MHAWGSLMPYHYDDGSEFSVITTMLMVNGMIIHGGLIYG